MPFTILLLAKPHQPCTGPQTPRVPGDRLLKPGDSYPTRNIAVALELHLSLRSRIRPLFGDLEYFLQELEAVLALGQSKSLQLQKHSASDRSH